MKALPFSEKNRPSLASPGMLEDAW